MTSRYKSLILGSSAIVFGLTLAGGHASAQSSGPSVSASTETDVVVVRGVRRSLEAAREIKRSSTQIVDAIVADDIGKLPDVNVAESLARVSGVQVDRGIGEGSDISVRGLRQNVILYNGRQIVDSTGRGGNGLDQLETSTYGLLGLVPSPLISRLEVTKLAGADQIAGALGGLVDIRTRKPLDRSSSANALNVSGTFDSQSEAGGYEIFGLATGKFANDTLGVLVTASASSRELSEEGLGTFSGYSRFTEGGITRFGHADIRAQEINETRDRVGASAMVQWQPNESSEFSFDAFYSKLTSDRKRHWLAFNPTSGLTNPVYSANNILLSGRASAAVLTNTEFANTEADVLSTALHASFDLRDGVSTTAEVSWGKSTSTYQQMYFRLQPIVGITPVVDFDLTKTNYGSFTINGIDLLNPAQLRFTILFDQVFTSESTTWAARNDWTIDVNKGAFTTLQAGARFSNLNTVQAPLRADIRPAGGLVANTLGDLVAVRSRPNFLSGGFSGLPRSYLVGSSKLTGCEAFTTIPVVSQNVQCTSPGTTLNSLAGTFEIEEDFSDLYLKANFEHEIGGVALSGNVGVRYISRDMTSVGNQISSTGTAVPVSFKAKDEKALPSAALRLELSDSFQIRAGLAQVVAFPNTEDLNNGLTLSNNAVFVNGVQTSPGTGSGGAPGLKPFEADQLDASLEWYFAKDSMVSVGLFYKDISTFIIQRQSAESYSGVNYLINRKINGEGANVQGIELLYQQPLSFLPAPFDGFGVNATYSYIKSETPIVDGSGRVLPLPGLSENNVNLVGYYEKGPVSFRLAYNWRDAYLLSLSAANTGIYNDSYSDLSASARYDFNDRYTLSFEAANLLDSEQRTFDGVEEALRTNVIYGRQYKLTLSAKF